MQRRLRYYQERTRNKQSIAVFSTDCHTNQHAACYGRTISQGASFVCGCVCHATRQINLPL